MAPAAIFRLVLDAVWYGMSSHVESGDHLKPPKTAQMKNWGKLGKEIVLCITMLIVRQEQKNGGRAYLMSFLRI